MKDRYDSFWFKVHEPARAGQSLTEPGADRDPSQETSEAPGRCNEGMSSKILSPSSNLSGTAKLFLPGTKAKFKTGHW